MRCVKLNHTVEPMCGDGSARYSRGRAGPFDRLMEQGLITHLAFNGAAIVHDFEFALIGKTTEIVLRYVSSGEFGLWRETGAINQIVKRAAQEKLGLGEAIGQEIAEERSQPYPYRANSLFAAAYRLGIPATEHVGIGYDICLRTSCL